ncbi:MAG TPA: tetratricopeptide repeat protein [Terracidiphilus sp.]|nr:tetratricopeptide repeat protein [Terracidiphilus sp.]
MTFLARKTLYVAASALLLQACAMPGNCQAAEEEPSTPPPAIASLGLPAPAASQLGAAVDRKDYVRAEKLLLAEIAKDPHSPRTAKLLDFAGSVYFLDHDYLNAAIAWKKSEAIAPLAHTLQFSLAMAYVRIGHSDWARRQLLQLAAEQPKNAIFPYWLGRLDYDAHDYTSAIRHFQQAIRLEPQMARAYDNLGLCDYYQNQNQLAIDNFRKAIALDRTAPHPSAWPYLNLAITEQFLNRKGDAEADLREAIRLDPGFAQAHFHLGSLLEGDGQLTQAVQEFQKAAQLDAAYAEPHMALARVYRKLGNQQAAKDEVQIYLRLRGQSKK